MKETRLFSVIIPCHNAAKTLERAVKSIYVDGKYMDLYEIILVINGCMDNTLQIAQMIQKKYKADIRIIESDIGVSKARNAGIRLAQGKWLVFLDADDMFTESAIECFIDDDQRVSADLYLYGHRKGNTNVHILDAGEKEHIYQNADLEYLMAEIISNPTRYMQVWAKLFRRDIVVKNQILFHEQLKLAEDSDFTLRYLFCCKSILFHDVPVYNYCLSMGSTVRTYDGKKVQEYIYSMGESQKVVANKSMLIQSAFDKYVLMHFNIAMVREVFCVESGDTFSGKLRRMKAVSNKDPFCNCIKSVPLKECRSIRMIPIFCLKLRMRFLAGFVYNMRAKQNFKRENRE